MAMLWLLNFGDGAHSLLDIAERAQLPFATIDAAAVCLEKASLLAPTKKAGVTLQGAPTTGPARK